MFQFLIGRLKTNAYKAVELGFAEFQFLIGRLKTPALPKLIEAALQSFNS